MDSHMPNSPVAVLLLAAPAFFMGSAYAQNRQILGTLSVEIDSDVSELGFSRRPIEGPRGDGGLVKT